MGDIVSIGDRIKRDCYNDVSEMLEAVKDYDIEVKVRPLEIKIILQELYYLYQHKNIIYQYKDDMNTYFNETMVMAIEEDKPITRDYLLNSLSVCQQLQTPVEIETRDMNKTLRKVNKRLKRIGEI